MPKSIRDLCQYRFRWWLADWWHQTTNWTIVYLPYISSFGIHTWVMFTWILKISITRFCLKFPHWNDSHICQESIIPWILMLCIHASPFLQQPCHWPCKIWAVSLYFTMKDVNYLCHSSWPECCKYLYIVKTIHQIKEWQNRSCVSCISYENPLCR